MEQNWKTKKVVSNFVELLALSTVKQFYPTAVQKYSEDINLEQAFDCLMDFSQSGEIHLLWEAKCPGSEESPFCLRTLTTTTSDYSKIVGEECFCDICGKEQCIEESHIFPVFIIDNEYRSYIRDESKKKLKNQRVRLKMK